MKSDSRGNTLTAQDELAPDSVPITGFGPPFTLAEMAKMAESTPITRHVGADEQIRARILDAAYECLLETGYSSRLHAAIAERSGYSRPTVYKYLGDQAAIIGGLMHRELGRFFAIAQTVLTTPGSPRERFIDVVVFSVQFGRQHSLLQKGLREHPEVMLPWFTIDSAPLITSCVEAFTPVIELMVRLGELPLNTDPRVVSEWTFRLASSLIMSPSILDLDDGESLRAYVDALLSVGATRLAQEFPASTFQPGGANT